VKIECYLLRQSSETLAGHLGTIVLSGFSLGAVGGRVALGLLPQFGIRSRRTGGHNRGIGEYFLTDSVLGYNLVNSRDQGEIEP